MWGRSSCLAPRGLRSRRSLAGAKLIAPSTYIVRAVSRDAVEHRQLLPTRTIDRMSRSGALRLPVAVVRHRSARLLAELEIVLPFMSGNRCGYPKSQTAGWHERVHDSLVAERHVE